MEEIVLGSSLLRARAFAEAPLLLREANGRRSWRSSREDRQGRCGRLIGGTERQDAGGSICFLNLRGDVLINRLYRDDVGYCPPFSTSLF